MGIKFKKAAAAILSAAMIIAVFPSAGTERAGAVRSENTPSASPAADSDHVSMTDHTYEPGSTSGPLGFHTPGPYIYSTGSPYRTSSNSSVTATSVPTVKPTSAPAVEDKTAPDISSASIKNITKKKKGFIITPAIKISWIETGVVETVKVYRAAGKKKPSLYRTIKSDSVTSFSDKKVKRGSKYTYRIAVTGKTSTGSAVERSSDTLSKSVPKKMTTPVFTTVKKGGRLTLKFSKAEGDFYETQYKYNKGRNSKKWTAIPSMKGKLVKNIRKKILANGFKIRIRTYVKNGKKKTYSAWKVSKSL